MSATDGSPFVERRIPGLSLAVTIATHVGTPPTYPSRPQGARFHLPTPVAHHPSSGSDLTPRPAAEPCRRDPPLWKPTHIYGACAHTAHARALLGLELDEAKWWPQGQEPGQSFAGGSPWLLVARASMTPPRSSASTGTLSRQCHDVRRETVGGWLCHLSCRSLRHHGVTSQTEVSRDA